MIIDNPIVSGSLNVQNDVTASNLAIASTASAAYFTGSFVGDGTQLSGVTSYTDGDTLDYINSLGVLSGSAQIDTDISGAFASTSQSLAERIASQESFSQSLDATFATDAQVASAVSSLNAATSSYLQNTTDTLTGDLTVTGKITAQEFHTEFVSASIIYESGSTKFGDSLDDIHIITGSVNITGSLNINGAEVGTGKLDETVFNSYTSSTDQRLDTAEGSISSLNNASSSYALEANVSGAFADTSSSLAQRIDNISTDFDDITNKPTLISSSLQFNTLTTPFTGSFTGSFSGDGSGLTGVNVGQVSSIRQTFTNVVNKVVTHNLGTKNINVSVYDDNDQLFFPKTVTLTDDNTVTLEFSLTSSGAVVVSQGGHIVSGSVPFENILNLPSLISSSTQFTDLAGPFTGSFTGSFYGDGSNLSGVTSYTDADTLTYINTLGVLSGSLQIASDISGAFDNTSSSLAQRITAQEGFSSSLDATFATDQQLSEVSGALALSISSISTDFADITNKPTLISSSAQIAEFGYLTSSSLGLNTKVGAVPISSFVNYSPGGSTESSASVVFATPFSSSDYQVTVYFPNVLNTGSFNDRLQPGSSVGVVNKTTTGFSVLLPYTEATLASNFTNGYSDEVSYIAVANGETAVTSSFTLLSATASYVEYDNVANKPTLVSSSLQFNTLTTPFTGSFTGSFYGDGSNLSGVTSYTDADTLAFINSKAVLSGSIAELTAVTASFFNTGSVTIPHSFNSKNVSVSVYDSNDILIIPQEIALVSNNAVKLTFGGSTSGFAVVSKGGHIVSGSVPVPQLSTVTSAFTSATSHTVTHNFNTKEVIVSVYENDSLIIPDTVTTDDVNNVTVTFPEAISGRVVVVKAGHIVSGSIPFDNLLDSPFVQSATTVTASKHIVPSADQTYDLGSPSLRFRDIYLSSASIYLGNTTITENNVVTTASLQSVLPAGVISGSNQLAGETIDGDLTITGKVTAQEFHTEFVSASIVYESGSTKFGDSADDIHQFTGSLNVLNGSESLYFSSSLGNGFRGLNLAGTNPSVRLDGAGDTFILSALSSGLAIWDETSTQYRVNILNNGNVGIGTTSPFAKLQVNGDFAAEDNIYLTDAGTIRGRFELNSSDRDDVDIKAVSLGSNMKFFTVDTERMRIDSNGNVGIGTASPSYKLEIAASQARILNSGEASWVFRDTNYGNITIGHGALSTGAGKFAIGGASADFVVNVDNSRVGIGTATPGQKLHVHGAIRLTDNPSVTGDGSSAQFWNQAGVGPTIAGNAFQVQINGTSPALQINNNGNVGIGITSPAHKLHIGAAYDDTIVLDDARSSGDTGTRFNSSIVWDAYYDQAARITLEHNDFNVTYRKLKFQVSGTTPGTYNDGIVLQQNGNVGIGIQTPLTKLQVGNGTDDDAVRVYHSDASFTEMRGYGLQFNRGASYLRPTATGKSMYFGTSTAYWTELQVHSNEHNWYKAAGSFAMRLDSNGNLGINEGAPKAKLHVSAPYPTYTDFGTVFYGGTTNNSSQNGIMLSSAGNALSGVLGSNLFIDGTTWSQTNTGRSTGWLQINNTTVAGKTSALYYRGYVKGSTTTVERFIIDGGGRVGINTSPQYDLHVGGTTARLRVGPVYTEGGDRDFVDLLADGQDSKIISNNERFHIENNAGHIVLNPSSGVIVKATSTSADLFVNGTTDLNGVIKYRKVYGSIDTTGNVVARLIQASNGASAFVRFECYGGGGYQRIVYNCINSGGNWSCTKQIDEGANGFDVTATSGIAPEFTFKGRTANQAYSPSVSIEGTALDPVYYS